MREIRPCPRVNSAFHGVPLPGTNVCLIGLKDGRLISEKRRFSGHLYRLALLILSERLRDKQNASKTRRLVHDFQSAGANLLEAQAHLWTTFMDRTWSTICDNSNENYNIRTVFGIMRALSFTGNN